MKHSFIPVGLAIIITVAAALFLGGCNRENPASSSQPTSLAGSEFAVKGMTCSGCEAGIKMAVGRLDGVDSVSASHEEGKAEVSYDPAKVSPEQIITVIDKLGYEASLQGSTPNQKED